MFDFEQWTEDMFRLVDSIEELKRQGGDISGHLQQLNAHWDEMIRHDDDVGVYVLKTMLANMKDVLNGKLPEEQFLQQLGELRENAVNQ